MTNTTITPEICGQAPTENVNCLEGIRCPQCGQSECLFITGTVRLEVTDDGADVADGSDWHWDNTSLTICPECDRDGPLTDFSEDSTQSDSPNQQGTATASHARLLKAGEAILANWERGDLAAAVRELAEAIAEVKELAV